MRELFIGSLLRLDELLHLQVKSGVRIDQRIDSHLLADHHRDAALDQIRRREKLLFGFSQAPVELVPLLLFVRLHYWLNSSAIRRFSAAIRRSGVEWL